MKDEDNHESFLTEKMVKAKGKGLKKGKSAKESDVSGSDTESNLRQAILDNTRHDQLDTETGGSGLNQHEDVDDGEDDVGDLDVEDEDVLETPEEEAARKKKEAADKKAAAAKKKAADKKAEDARKAKKAAEAAKEKEVK